mmetsp:Transcript_40543/g.102072  ORF Transcript_40543/g.102072 Transcript_40543/m.102072 type:complete len:599 (-) Transcript_40543:12-1808(-)
MKPEIPFSTSSSSSSSSSALPSPPSLPTSTHSSQFSSSGGTSARQKKSTARKSTAWRSPLPVYQASIDSGPVLRPRTRGYQTKNTARKSATSSSAVKNATTTASMPSAGAAKSPLATRSTSQAARHQKPSDSPGGDGSLPAPKPSRHHTVSRMSTSSAGRFRTPAPQHVADAFKEPIERPRPTRKGTSAARASSARSRRSNAAATKAPVASPKAVAAVVSQTQRTRSRTLGSKRPMPVQAKPSPGESSGSGAGSGSSRRRKTSSSESSKQSAVSKPSPAATKPSPAVTKPSPAATATGGGGSSSAAAASSSSSTLSSTTDGDKGVEEASDLTCGICLDDVKIRGVLNSCAHMFCFTCITQWSEVQNTCPMCKRRFDSLTERQIDGKKRKRFERVVKVAKKNQRSDQPYYSNIPSTGLDLPGLLLRHFLAVSMLPGYGWDSVDEDDDEDDDDFYPGRGGTWCPDCGTFHEVDSPPSLSRYMRPSSPVYINLSDDEEPASPDSISSYSPLYSSSYYSSSTPSSYSSFSSFSSSSSSSSTATSSSSSSTSAPSFVVASSSTSAGSTSTGLLPVSDSTRRTRSRRGVSSTKPVSPEDVIVLD